MQIKPTVSSIIATNCIRVTPAKITQQNTMSVPVLWVWAKTDFWSWRGGGVWKTMASSFSDRNIYHGCGNLQHFLTILCILEVFLTSLIDQRIDNSFWKLSRLQRLSMIQLFWPHRIYVYRCVYSRDIEVE